MFDVHSRAVHDVEPTVLVKSTKTVALGVAMTAGGDIASGAVTPAYICAGAAVTVGSDKFYPAIRVLPHIEFATECAGSQTAGAAYTLATTGDGITTTATDGKFTVTKVDGTTAYGHF